jgi:hypothetical protein
VLTRSTRLHFGVLGFLLVADLCPGCDGQAQSPDPLESETRAAKKTAAASTPETPVAIPSDGTATVSVRINQAPVIDNMTATPSPLEVNVAASLLATASDADGDSLTFEWSSACDGHFVDDGPNPRFTLQLAPASASCTFHVVAQDGAGGSGQGDLVVPVGSPVVIETGAPVVGLVFQSTDVVEPDQTVTLGIDAADANRSLLVFEWSATAGRLTDQQDLQPQGQTPGKSTMTWTAPAEAGSAWDVTVIVRNRAGAETSYVFSNLRQPG